MLNKDRVRLFEEAGGRTGDTWQETLNDMGQLCSHSALLQIHEDRTCKFLSGREILAQRAVWGKAQSREKKKRCTRTTDKGTRESGQGGRKAEGLGAAQDRTV